MTVDHKAHMAAMAAELENRPPITLVLSAPTALQLAGLLQLALRHPRLAEQANVSRTAVMLLEQLRAYFGDAPVAPVTLAVMRAGDDPANDV